MALPTPAKPNVSQRPAGVLEVAFAGQFAATEPSEARSYAYEAQISIDGATPVSVGLGAKSIPITEFVGAPRTLNRWHYVDELAPGADVQIRHRLVKRSDSSFSTGIGDEKPLVDASPWSPLSDAVTISAFGRPSTPTGRSTNAGLAHRLCRHHTNSLVYGQDVNGFAWWASDSNFDVNAARYSKVFTGHNINRPHSNTAGSGHTPIDVDDYADIPVAFRPPFASAPGELFSIGLETFLFQILAGNHSPTLDGSEPRDDLISWLSSLVAQGYIVSAYVGAPSVLVLPWDVYVQGPLACHAPILAAGADCWFDSFQQSSAFHPFTGEKTPSKLLLELFNSLDRDPVGEPGVRTVDDDPSDGIVGNHWYGLGRYIGVTNIGLSTGGALNLATVPPGQNAGYRGLYFLNHPQNQNETLYRGLTPYNADAAALLQAYIDWKDAIGPQPTDEEIDYAAAISILGGGDFPDHVGVRQSHWAGVSDSRIAAMNGAIQALVGRRRSGLSIGPSFSI